MITFHAQISINLCRFRRNDYIQCIYNSSLKQAYEKKTFKANINNPICYTKVRKNTIFSIGCIYINILYQLWLFFLSVVYIYICVCVYIYMYKVYQLWQSKTQHRTCINFSTQYMSGNEYQLHTIRSLRVQCNHRTDRKFPDEHTHNPQING